MLLHDQTVSEEDFEQLPPVLQRKYFSSLERLRLAQDASNHFPKSPLRSQFPKRPATSHAWSTRKPSVSSSTSSDRSFSVTSLSRNPSRSRLRKASKALISPSATLIDLWEFATLPPAIQRKQFSAEEQYRIASRLNLVILDAADEAIYKKYLQRSQSAISCSLHSVTEDLDIEDVFDEDEDEDEDERDMNAEDLESFRWLDQETDLDLRLDDYHTFNADIHRDSSTSLNRRSSRRGFSFSNVSFRRRSSSSTSLHNHSMLNQSKSLAASTIAQPQTQPQSLHQSKPSCTLVDPLTTHYQDPDAKMKLRVYLASPQKFDEALEFGFPSLNKEATHSPARPRTTQGFTNGQPKTFFADDTPSLSGDDSPDEVSDYLYQDSPRTPIDATFPTHRPSQKSSIDRSFPARPRVLASTVEPYSHVPAADREMTLRMTLTRPELRALEGTEHAKPIAVNDMPLEKAPLTIPFSDSRTIWDELPEEPSRFKRLMKKFTGQSRSS